MVNGCFLDLNLRNINKDDKFKVGVKFKEFYLEVETTILSWTVINVIRDTMGKNFIVVCSFSGIVHSISPSIKLRLKEWNKNPSEYKAGFLG
jgi:hypothetical protein